MQNGRLDVATLVDWDGYQNYLDPEAAAQWIGARNAYFDEIGVWLYTDECYRAVGEPGDLARGRINTQWYWKEWWTREGKPWNAATPGTNSTHGWGKGIDLLTWPERAALVRIMAAYGWAFNVDGEPWHMSYIGNPAITAEPINKEDELSAEFQAHMRAQLNQVQDLLTDISQRDLAHIKIQLNQMQDLLTAMSRKDLKEIQKAIDTIASGTGIKLTASLVKPDGANTVNA